jgi:hypothetical protein
MLFIKYQLSLIQIFEYYLTFYLAINFKTLLPLLGSKITCVIDLQLRPCMIKCFSVKDISTKRPSSYISHDKGLTQKSLTKCSPVAVFFVPGTL